MKENIQKHVLETNQKYLGKLVNEQLPAKLENQLEDMDWSLLDMIDNKVQERGEFSPLGAMEISEIDTRRDEFDKAGLEAIKACKVGAILLAGGQGTRLGFDKAKGMYNIGLNRDLYIFEQLICNLMKVTERAGAWVPLYIMTSDKNDEQTREFFAAFLKKFFLIFLKSHFIDKIALKSIKYTQKNFLNFYKKLD